MNENIEVINECLWAVNMNYLKLDYIQELKLIKESGHINLTDQGVLVIDKSSKLFPAMKMLLPKLMEKRTDELQSILDASENAVISNSLDDLIINLCGWELKRRSVKNSYSPDIKNNRMARFKAYWKKVIKWVVFGQE